MYLIEKDEELSYQKVTSIIQKFQTKDALKLNQYYNYFKGKQDILRKTVTDASKPCNRIVTNYCFNVVNNYCGYLTGIDITYTSDEDITDIQDILNYNDVSSTDSLLLRNALIYGVAFEIAYVDEEGQQRFRVLDSRECIPVYYNNLNNDLACVIRFYRIDDIDTQKYYIEVYEADRTRRFNTDTSFSTFGLISEEPNYFKQVPITVFPLNEEQESIFDKIITLQDAYNTLLSAEVDDFSAFCDAYLVLKNLDADAETIQTMKENRVLILPEEGEASYLTKSISDTQIENMLSNINDTIHKIANSPDFSQESYGTSSGIALKYRLLGFENTASAIEKNMTKAIQRRIELICSILTLKGDDVWRDVQILFTRNIPTDMSDLMNTISNLRGLVSDKTLVSQIPFVQDIDAEMDSIAEQNEDKMKLYAFPHEQKDDEE